MATPETGHKLFTYRSDRRITDRLCLEAFPPSRDIHNSTPIEVTSQAFRPLRREHRPTHLHPSVPIPSQSPSYPHSSYSISGLTRSLFGFRLVSRSGSLLGLLSFLRQLPGVREHVVPPLNGTRRTVQLPADILPSVALTVELDGKILVRRGPWRAVTGAQVLGVALRWGSERHGW